MTPAELEQYLHDHIPMSRAMAVAVVSASPEGVVLSAPLEPNINHRDTVFGGSAAAIAVLSAWSLVHLRLLAEAREVRLVIRRNTMDYDAPIAGRFEARAFLSPHARWDVFLKSLDRYGKAQVAAHSQLTFEDKAVGYLTADFAALRA